MRYIYCFPRIAIFSLFLVSFTLLSSTSPLIHAASAQPQFPMKRNAPLFTAQKPNCGGWTVIPSPNSGTNDNYLFGVAAISANNIWAVGYTDNNGIPFTLIEHWDGTQWSVVPSPNPGSNNVLHAVAQVPGTNEAWAVGVTTNGSNQTLIEHWDGTSWSVVPSPNPGTQYNYLQGITAISAHTIWIVGLQVSSGNQQTLTERWNGKKWKVISSSNVEMSSNLQAVARVPGTHDVWAVGVYETYNTQIIQTLIEYWNGMSWNVVSSPNVGSNRNYLNGVVALSTNNAWAVGDVYNSNDNNMIQTLTEHWDGASWSAVPSPNPGTQCNYLNSVTQVPGTNQVWAVGQYVDNNGVSQTLTEFYC